MFRRCQHTTATAEGLFRVCGAFCSRLSPRASNSVITAYQGQVSKSAFASSKSYTPEHPGERILNFKVAV